ncbi:hypothetical protein JAAARDRAFT_195145 [Jaapia argillacea MUCL 33604]|uniref:Jacalin-type lectin domain-containing protein n=1 Tax=Jaapia argillacea MUCL 33604 TaxID=933084 RepID=A0A067PZX5_9AGAM|nr:hypothetical protein JAAARDRAFT_195145 [Jaapia argillacea MUCL 33604]
MDRLSPSPLPMFNTIPAGKNPEIILMGKNPIQNISITSAVGDVAAVSSESTTVTDFNDAYDIAKFPYSFLLDKRAPIQQIDFTGDKSIKGIRVTYRKRDHTTVSVVHGKKPPEGSPCLKLTDAEIITLVAGNAGMTCDGPVKAILQLKFCSLNKDTSEIKTSPVFGNPSRDPPLFYAAGPVMAFMGKSTPEYLLSLALVMADGPVDEAGL